MFSDKWAQCKTNAGTSNPPTTTIPDSANVWSWNRISYPNAATYTAPNLDYAPAFGYTTGGGDSTPANGVQKGWALNVLFQDKPYSAECGLASSPHTGGLVVSMADGSGRIIAPEVDTTVWQLLLQAKSATTPSGDY